MGNMTKTPEQMAADWYIRLLTEKPAVAIKEAYQAGYQAAKDETNLPTSAKWISVKERLPEHNIPVLVFDTLANTIELMSWDKIMEAFGTEDAYFVELNEASHWMPLPELPEKK